MLKKFFIPNKLMLKVKVGSNIELLPAGFLITADNALEAVVRPHRRPNATLRVLGLTTMSTRSPPPSEESLGK